jgi:DNA primase catalytic subunit
MKTKKDLTKQPQWVQDEFKKLQIKIARLEKEQQNSSQFAIARLENKIKELRKYYADIVTYQIIIENFGLKMTEVNSEVIKEKLKMVDFFIKQIQEIQKPI